MSVKKDDKLYIADIVHEIASIKKFTKGMSWNGFEKDELVRRAVERSIEIIGEACRCISEKFRLEHAEVPWKKIIGMRNLISHAYGDVDYAQVWAVVEKDIPALEQALKMLEK